MLRSLALTPWDSFTPALLRSEPAALGAWIRYRFVRWLLTTPLVNSGWRYGGPDPETANDQLLVGGATEGHIELWNGNDNLELHYRFPGTGFEIGNAIPHTLTQTLPSMRGETILWLNGHHGHSGVERAIGDLMGTRCAAAVDLSLLVDAQVTRGGKGTACAAMLFGVRPELRADLSKLSMYTRQLSRLADEPASRHVRYTPGVLRTDWSPVDRAINGGVDLRQIQEEAEFIFSQHAFRGIVFFPKLRGNNAEGEMSAYIGEITNMSEDDKGAMPPKIDLVNKALSEVGKSPKEIKKDLIESAKETIKNDLEKKLPLSADQKKLVDFALGEVGKKPKDIKADLLGEAKSLLKDKLPIQNETLKKVVDFGIDEIGKKGKDIKADLIGQAKDLVKDKIPIQNDTLKKVVDFGVDEIGKKGKEIKGDLGDLAKDIGGDFLKEHKDQLLQYKYPAIAAAAVALASSKAVRTAAVNAIKDNEGAIAKVAFNELGQKVGLSSNTTSFLANNADAIVKGDWQTVGANAIAQQIGGGPFTQRAAAIVLEKMTGQAVTTRSLAQLGAQGLKSIIDSGSPAVASGSSGDAAVTAVGKDAATGADTVTVANGVTPPKTMSHSGFMSLFSTVASLGVV